MKNTLCVLFGLLLLNLVPAQYVCAQTQIPKPAFWGFVHKYGNYVKPSGGLSASFLHVGDTGFIQSSADPWLRQVWVDSKYLDSLTGWVMRSTGAAGYTQDNYSHIRNFFQQDESKYNQCIILYEDPAIKDEYAKSAMHESIHAAHYARGLSDDYVSASEGNAKVDMPELITGPFHNLVGQARKIDGYLIRAKNDPSPANIEHLKKLAEQIKTRIAEFRSESDKYGAQFYSCLSNIKGYARFDGYIQALDDAIKDLESKNRSSFDGTWNTTWGTLTMKTSADGQVHGTYSYKIKSGRAQGTIDGTINEQGTLVAVWTERSKTAFAKGKTTLQLSADGNSFAGHWVKTAGQAAANSGDWKGTRVAESPPV